MNPGLFHSKASAVNHYVLWLLLVVFKTDYGFHWPFKLYTLDSASVATPTPGWCSLQHMSYLGATGQLPFSPAIGDSSSWMHVLPLSGCKLLAQGDHPHNACIPAVHVHREIQFMPAPWHVVKHTNLSPFADSGTLGLSLNLSEIILSSLETHIEICFTEILGRFKNSNNHLYFSFYCRPEIVCGTGH